jgi:hypothetical protein
MDILKSEIEEVQAAKKNAKKDAASYRFKDQKEVDAFIEAKAKEAIANEAVNGILKRNGN